MLTQALGWDFYDADGFHPPENIAKTAKGIPLDDQGRAPWLTLLHNIVIKAVTENRPGVLACSALKERYREVLTENAPNVLFIKTLARRPRPTAGGGSATSFLLEIFANLC